MPGRWRARLTGLAIGVALAGSALAVGATGSAADGRTLTVSTTSGEMLARVSLPDGGAFAMRYRNSVYGSLVEEWFSVTDDGELELTELRADELAVLEEYYAAERATPTEPGAARAWHSQPALTVREAAVRVAATSLGERTLVVEGTPPLALWRLVDEEDPIVILEVQP